MRSSGALRPPPGALQEQKPESGRAEGSAPAEPPKSEFYGDPARVTAWSVSALAFLFVSLAVWKGGLDAGKHYFLRAVIGDSRQGPWNFRRLLEDACRRDLMQRVGGGYMFVHRPLLDHFAGLDLPPPDAVEVREWEGVPARSTAPAIATMVALGVIGAVMLFVSLEASAAAAIVGTVLLARAAVWLVVRSAIASAMRADRREGEDG